MRTQQTFRVYFTLKTEKAKDGKAPLYVAITVNKEKCFLALKDMVPLSIWDTGKGAAKGTREDARSLNRYLEEVRVKIGNCYKELQLADKPLTAKAIKTSFLGEDQEYYTLTRLMRYHNETAGKSLNPATLKHYEVTQRYLIKFLKSNYKAADFDLRDLDYRFIQEFDTFLRNYKPIDHHKPISNNGVKVHLVRLKKMVHLAINLDWMDKNPFVKFKIKMKKVAREFLTEAELSSIENKVFKVERLAMIRDLFIFSCYTGLAYSDLMKLTPKQVVKNGNEIWVRTAREKTLEPVNLPLLSRAVTIMNKYLSDERALYNGTLFPVISNQKVNSYLKEIADICEVHKNLTFHMARHTFATTVTLSNGVPIETVSKILGHTKVSTTQIYARVVEKKLQADMLALEKRLS